MLGKKYQPAPKIVAEGKEFEYHKSFKKVELIPDIKINLKEFKTKEEKETALNNLIMEQANKSLKNYDKFYSLVKKICYNNDGFGFKAGVKIKNISQKTALLRIKEKMLTNIYKERLKQ